MAKTTHAGGFTCISENAFSTWCGENHHVYLFLGWNSPSTWFYPKILLDFPPKPTKLSWYPEMPQPRGPHVSPDSQPARFIGVSLSVSVCVCVTSTNQPSPTLKKSTQWSLNKTSQSEAGDEVNSAQRASCKVSFLAIGPMPFCSTPCCTASSSARLYTWTFATTCE